jgi:hypothetical protein
MIKNMIGDSIMNKKTLALVLEIIPLISVIATFVLVFANLDSDVVRTIILITVTISFFGFIFGIIGRKLSKGDKLIKVLSIFDFLCPVFIIGLYVLVFIAIGMSI